MTFDTDDHEHAILAQELIAIRNADEGPTPDPVCKPPISLKEIGGLRLHILGSGSKGNCAIIESPHGLILIDAGFSAKETLARMQELFLNPCDVHAIMLTHEHSDHSKGAGVIMRKLKVPLYTTFGAAASRSSLFDLCPYVINSRDQFSLAGITIKTFPTSHDAADPFGFRFESSDGDAIGFVTDTGILSQEARELLSDTRVLALESNHDPHMLEVGPYPRYLKERIASERGHFSNKQAASALQEGLTTRRTQFVIGMHLSETNNTPIVGEKALRYDKHLDYTTCVARQNRPRTFG